MLSIEHKKRGIGRKTAIVIASLLVVISAACAGYWWWTHHDDGPAASKAVSAAKPVATTKSLSSKMLVMGDVYWGRYINDWSQASSLKYAYPFQKLSEFSRDNYNAWIADMECPITNNPKVSSAVEDDTLQFDCSPDYLPEAKKWFTAMTLANNHTDNQGPAGLVETRQHLGTNGMQYFGTYEPEDYDHVCDVLALPAEVTMSDATKKQVKLPMVWCGYHGVFKTPSADSIAVMKRYTDYFPVVAMPHSGAEYKAEPDTIKTDFYRRLIDGGADVVIGDHAHWTQSSEAYKGHLIMYSVGNFIFDQQYNAEVTRSAVLDMSVCVAAADNPDLEKWIKLADDCAGYQDSCLQTAKDQGLKKLVLDYHFGVKASNNGGKLVHLATAEQLASVKDRLKWTNTIKGLSGQYSGE